MDIEQMKSALSEGISPLKEAVEGLKKQGADLAERVAKIEATPAVKAPAIVRSGSYKGYNLSNQLAKIRNEAKHSPLWGNEEKADEFAKFMIDFVKAKIHHDPQAKADLTAFYQKANLIEIGRAHV